MDSFNRLVAEAQKALEEALAGDVPTDPENVIVDLFAHGREVGLTDKEISQAVFRSSKVVLRPGLRR